MTKAYFDAAYVAKCYLHESDATRVREVASRHEALHTSSFSLAELACVFHRQMRDGLLNKSSTQMVQDQFRKDVDDGVWILEAVTERILQQVELRIGALDAGIFLRAGDAIHLVTAAEAGFSRSVDQRSPHADGCGTIWTRRAAGLASTIGAWHEIRAYCARYPAGSC